jgi:hypothetical protein
MNILTPVTGSVHGLTPHFIPRLASIKYRGTERNPPHFLSVVEILQKNEVEICTPRLFVFKQRSHKISL